MLGKNTIKNIKSLHLKKYRNEQNKFLVEGAKSLQELLKSDLQIKSLYLTQEFINKNTNVLNGIDYEIISFDELKRITTLKTNSDGLAIVYKKENKHLLCENDLVLILDDIKDPGNLGTIVRIADWYGITKIIASNTTTDFYNPKTIISTMGSFSRISIFYTDLVEFLSNNSENIYGAFLDGENIHQAKLNTTGYIVIGNESNGISKEVEKFVTQKITIPCFGSAESLNAGVATGIILDNFKRK